MPLYDYEDEIVHENNRESAVKPIKKRARSSRFLKMIGLVIVAGVGYLYWMQAYA